jgi:hypothetical protein
MLTPSVSRLFLPKENYIKGIFRFVQHSRSSSSFLSGAYGTVPERIKCWHCGKHVEVPIMDEAHKKPCLRTGLL